MNYRETNEEGIINYHFKNEKKKSYRFIQSSQTTIPHAGESHAEVFRKHNIWSHNQIKSIYAFKWKK